MSTVQTSPVLDKIRSRGHWSIVIRPAVFDESRVPYDELFPILEKNSVRFRAQDYPQVDRRRGPDRGPDWVGQEFDRDDSIEVWRFYTSGLFIHRFALRDPSQSWRVDSNEATNRCLDFLDVVHSFLEIFELAARLALSQAGGNPMRVEIAVKNIQGRRIYPDFWIIRQGDNFRANRPEWANSWDVSQTELIAMPGEFAAQAARDFFEEFGASFSLDVFKQHQEKRLR